MGYKDIEIRKSEFVAKTQLLWRTINFHYIGKNIVITVIKDKFHKVVLKLADIEHTKICSSRSFT